MCSELLYPSPGTNERDEEGSQERRCRDRPAISGFAATFGASATDCFTINVRTSTSCNLPIYPFPLLRLPVYPIPYFSRLSDPLPSALIHIHPARITPARLRCLASQQGVQVCRRHPSAPSVVASSSAASSADPSHRPARPSCPAACLLLPSCPAACLRPARPSCLGPCRLAAGLAPVAATLHRARAS
jgi:hypothetical protein